jgi:putative toxin-antitoxin system antitoxin component (TIGR02293 family)
LADADIMPLMLWHNVRMSQAVAIPALEAPLFQFDCTAVEKGIPLSALEEFSAYSGFALKDVIEVVIPPRTLKHRRQRNEPLNVDESDRLARVARLYDLGVQVFGNPEKARRWLSKPKRQFDERTPLTMMRTEVGGRGVEEMLIQIDEGMFA